MKNKIIYILRHGETDYNKKGMVQGRGVNASLNEFGRKQGQAVYKALAHESFDHLYLSELVRTKETTQDFIKSGVGFTKLEGLDEISWGNQEGVVASKEAKTLYAQTVKDWQNGELTKAVGGGESPIQVMERQKEAIDIILTSTHRKILVCMHGRAIRILLSWLLNYPLNFMDGFPHSNCAYYKLLWNGTFFTVEEFNEAEHLSTFQ